MTAILLLLSGFVCAFLERCGASPPYTRPCVEKIDFFVCDLRSTEYRDYKSPYTSASLDFILDRVITDTGFFSLEIQSQIWVVSFPFFFFFFKATDDVLMRFSLLALVIERNAESVFTGFAR